MVIGIDASRAFLRERTGIEEYAYQILKHLKDKLGENQVVLYLRESELNQPRIDELALPKHWKVIVIRWPIFWTQLGLSLELLLHPVDVLFVPAHTVPLIHPRDTVVTIHGLEYEFCPAAYSWWERIYMRCSIRLSCWWARKIIAVSENTRKDLVQLYKIPAEKITVVYEGYNADSKSRNTNYKPQTSIESPYLLFVGRLEERKNVIGTINAFKILKETYHIPHKLVLAGKPGYGYQKIQQALAASEASPQLNRDETLGISRDIIETGFVSEAEKWHLLSQADVFLFPSFYEGFGLPILEAQAAGVPVITSRAASMEEVAGIKSVLVNPNDHQEIAQAAHQLLEDQPLRSAIIEAGRENVLRFSWERSANLIAKMLIK